VRGPEVARIIVARRGHLVCLCCCSFSAGSMEKHNEWMMPSYCVSESNRCRIDDWAKTSLGSYYQLLDAAHLRALNKWKEDTTPFVSEFLIDLTDTSASASWVKGEYLPGLC
jgi:hypothetical protein